MADTSWQDGLLSLRPQARLRPLGFGAAAFARFGLRKTELACRAVAREASEGWWGRKDSNLRSHEAADLQSAPFATRDTPPFRRHCAAPAKRGGTQTPWRRK